MITKRPVYKILVALGEELGILRPHLKYFRNHEVVPAGAAEKKQ
jgi:hypothetical protein